VTWQLNPSALNAAKDASQSDYTATARGLNSPTTDASNQFSFKSAGASEASSAFAEVLSKKIQPSATTSAQPDQSLLFASSDTSARPTTELDEAMAKSFDEDFVSVPTVQFASAATSNLPGASVAEVSGPGPVPVPEMSALFPIVGLIAAVSCTQILRRRRAAQQNASRSLA
jgi:hypothetical protein